MEPHKIILSLLFFGLFITGGIFIMKGSAENPDEEEIFFNRYDDVSVNIDSFDRTEFSDMEVENEVYNKSSDLSEQLETDELETDAELVLVTGPYKAFQKIREYYSTFGRVFSTISKMLDIPPFVITFLMVSLFIILIFIMAYFFRGFQPRT